MCQYGHKPIMKVRNMSSTIAEPAPLTKLDIKAMRQAHSVSFSHKPVTDEPRGKIRMTRKFRRDESDPYGDAERECKLTVDSHVRAYSLNQDHCSTNVSATATCHCFWSSVMPTYDCWSAVCALVREGDELVLQWNADSTNDYMRRAQRGQHNLVHVDSLRLQIYRKRQPIYTLILDESYCEDNSARMIRGYSL